VPVGLVIHLIVELLDVALLGGSYIAGINHPDTDSFTAAQIDVAGVFHCLLMVLRVQAADMAVIQATLGTDENFEQG
jgi:hypothetical protein